MSGKVSTVLSILLILLFLNFFGIINLYSISEPIKNNIEGFLGSLEKKSEDIKLEVGDSLTPRNTLETSEEEYKSSLIEITEDMTTIQKEEALKHNAEVLAEIERNKIRYGILKDVVPPNKDFESEECVNRVKPRLDYGFSYDRYMEMERGCSFRIVLIDEDMKIVRGNSIVHLYFSEPAKIRKLLEISPSWSKGTEMSYQGENFKTMLDTGDRMYNKYVEEYAEDIVINDWFDRHPGALELVNKSQIKFKESSGYVQPIVPVGVEGRGITITPS